MAGFGSVGKNLLSDAIFNSKRKVDTISTEPPKEPDYDYERGGELLGTVASDSSNKKYQIFGHPGRHFRCTCMAWKFQKKPPTQRSCKHIDLFNRVSRECFGLSNDPRVVFTMEE